jgi:hypothetical protein
MGCQLINICYTNAALSKLFCLMRLLTQCPVSSLPSILIMFYPTRVSVDAPLVVMVADARPTVRNALWSALLFL